MTYNNPQHNTNKYSCTPFPILKEGDTSGGIVTYLDLVDLGSISGFGVNLTEIGGTQRWDNTIITSWQTLFDAINEHLTIFNARLQELEQSANPDAITIISKSNNQLEANVNNVFWSSDSSYIDVNPKTGKTTTYLLSDSATSYGSFTLNVDNKLIEEGESITITAQWTGKTTTYDAIITATKSGMTPATKSVQLHKEAICPTSVTLDNGKTIALNSSGRGTLTYTPSVGNYTVKTQGNETPGSCSFTVAASQPTTTYYWYVGTTLPTAANLLSIATGSATSKPDWSTPYSIAATNNTGESSYMYYCFPAEWNVMVLDSDRATEVALAQEGTITVNNITYNIQRTGRKISNGTSKDYYAIFNNGEAITITSKSNNQLEANVDNVFWSSDSSYIDVNPKTGKTTTYLLSDSATSYGSFTLTASESSIEEGESITITAQWYGNTIPYSATITATKAGMKSATKQVQLSKEATCPAYVRLDNGETITLNSSGRGTYTYTPTVGSYTITTQGNETSGSCSFTVNESMPKTITITSKSNNQLEANVDNVFWSSDSSYIDVNPKTGKTTTYLLSDSATSYGSFTLNVDNKLIEEGESITITAQWYEYTTPYSATITATKAGMKSATKFVQLSKAATCPSYVYLDNGARITLDSNGRGTYTYTPTVGNYTIRTQGNETQGSCSFTVNEVTPVVEPVNADIVAVYNIQDTSKSTKLSDNASSFKAMEIDGVVQPSVVTSYKFDRHGNHTIKYELNGSNIGDNAFDGCSDLRSIDILNSVTSIGDNVFDNCTGLASCTIGNGVTSIGNTAFNCCSDLSSITIGNSVTSIGDTAFAVCNELTSIDIPNSVTSIGEYAFQDCSNLTSITLSNRLTKISNSAFEGCSSLTSIDIPDGVTNIDDYAFNGCSGLTNVTIGSGVTRIGGDAFYGCSSLTSIDIPDSVTKIGERAFENCTSLINVTSHAMTAPDISNNTFRNVKTGGTLTVSYYSSSDYNDVWLSTDNYYLGKYNWNMKYYDEPETITITSKSNNQLEANVNNVNWSSDNSYIDVNPTSGKTTTYSLSDSATSYGSFTLTASESSIEEGESITITAQWTGHSRRYSATITASKPGMISTRKEVQLYIEETCPAYVDLDNGARITLDSNGRGTYTYTPTVGNYTIKTQGNETPGSCSFTVNEVTPVVEPVNADIIAQYNIQSTWSPTTICSYSSNIKAMEIDGVVKPFVIESYKFNTTGTHTIKYELNDSSIDGGTFASCSSLTSIDILDSVTSIGNGAFARCTGLTSIDIPDSVTSIGSSAFQNCTGLTSVTIGNSVTSIGDVAFAGCSGLTSIVIPSSVTSIGNYAFSGCNKLTSITSNRMTAPTIYNTTFQDVKTGGTLTVSYYSSGYDDTYHHDDTWLSTSTYYLGYYDWNIEYYDAPETITITSKSGNQLEANVDNVFWSSDSSYINVYPETGQTTTYLLSDSATSYGSFTLTTNKSSIQEGESITITAQWYGKTTTYDATITATNPGMTPATKFVQLSKAATCPASVTLDNGQTITLNISSGTCTYTPVGIGNYTVTTQGNETPGSCSFTVNESMPKTITITSKSGNQLEANVDNVNWSSDNSYIDVNPTSGKTTTYSLTDSATSYGSFTLTTNKSSIQEGENIVITAQWTGKTTTYDTIITATKSGMTSATKQVTLSKEATCPAYVYLSNGARITLDTNSGRGTYTYTPAVGNYIIRTYGNETQDSCSFTVVAAVNVNADLIAYYNVQNISSPTSICINNRDSFKSMEIDGVDSVNITTQGEIKYQFNTTGAHTIKYELNGSSIGNGAFSGNIGSLTSVDILDSVTSIGDGAFAGRSGLTSIDIPDSVTSIGSSAFSGCGCLTSVTIGNGVTSIGSTAFAGCIRLTSIDIPDSVTSIGNFAFNGCSGLTSVTIGNGVTKIGDRAFAGCSGLTSIVSNAMTAPQIQSDTFQNVKNNGRLTISYYSSGYDTWLSTGDYFLGKYDWVRKYDDAPNVEPINEDIVAYYNIQDTSSPTTICDNRGNKFKSMEIDGVVQSSVVSSYQFNTTGTHTIKYELNDSNIANGAFSTCTSLTSCTIGNGVTKIGMGAFAGCSGLTSIDIPDSVTSIGTNAFSGCSSLTSIVCNAMTAPNISSSTFASIATDGTLTIPTDSSGYDVWLGEGNYYLGKYGWHPEPM